MDFIQPEINKHKTQLKTLINNLINTENINEEIMYNNQIKMESEFIISLLNAKQNNIMNQMIQNNNMNFNPINFNPNMMQMNQPQILRNDENNLNDFQVNNFHKINVFFIQAWNNRLITLICSQNEKISDLIQKYRDKSNDYNNNIEFIFNSKKLDLSKTIFESEIINNSRIYIYKTKDILNFDNPENGIKLKFINKSEHKEYPIIVGVIPNEKFEKVIEKYNSLICNTFAPIKKFRFIFDDKCLEPSLTLIESGITQDCIIYIEPM